MSKVGRDILSRREEHTHMVKLGLIDGIRTMNQSKQDSQVCEICSIIKLGVY